MSSQVSSPPAFAPNPSKSISDPAPASLTTVELPAVPALPQPILTTEESVSTWQTTPGFRAFWSWCMKRCDRIKGKEVLGCEEESAFEPIRFLLDMLNQMISWIDEAPALPQANQRFGNLAFRSYYKLLEERLPPLWSSPSLPAHLSDQVIPLLINSTAFGQPTRLDYGSGHELAFILVLWCCVASGWTRVGGGDDEQAVGEEVEDELILRVFARYLDLVTLLQQTYKLEPAGSHGVWGLDDYCFFPYLFGSAQLLDSPTSPTQALANATSPSVPSSSLTNFYTLSLRRITLFKRGASFSEHSPLLHNLSQMPNWQKPHFGLRKMFMGEVVGKRVVVQGLWIGGWCWGENMPGIKDRKRHSQRGAGGDAWERDIGTASGSQRPDQPATAAPWANAQIRIPDGRAGVLQDTRALWSSGPPRR